jgi:hypothetical protein
MKITKYGKVTIDFRGNSADPEITIQDFEADAEHGKEGAPELASMIRRMAIRELEEATLPSENAETRQP